MFDPYENKKAESVPKKESMTIGELLEQFTALQVKVEELSDKIKIIENRTKFDRRLK